MTTFSPFSVMCLLSSSLPHAYDTAIKIEWSGPLARSSSSREQMILSGELALLGWILRRRMQLSVVRLLYGDGCFIFNSRMACMGGSRFR